MATLETCPRCGNAVDVMDLNNDPRWGTVCVECFDELSQAHGDSPP